MCPYGDLKNWLKEHHENYVKTNDAKSSMFNQLSNRLKRPITANFRITKNISLEDSLKAADFNPNNLNFNDSDLTFFGYQIAKGKRILLSYRIVLSKVFQSVLFFFPRNGVFGQETFYSS